MKINFGKLVMDSFPIAITVAVITTALSWILGLFNFKVTSLMATIPLSSGITGTFGGNVIKFIDGIIPLGFSGDMLMNLIAIIVTTMAIYIAGTLVTGLLATWNVPTGKTRTQKFAVILFAGTLIIYLITAGTAGFATLLNWQLIVGLAIYYAVVAFAANLAINQFKLKLAL